MRNNFYFFVRKKIANNANTIPRIFSKVTFSFKKKNAKSTVTIKPNLAILNTTLASPFFYAINMAKVPKANITPFPTEYLIRLPLSFKGTF